MIRRSGTQRELMEIIWEAGSITLPARDEPYILALSGADYETETPYAVRMNQAPATDGDGLIEPELVPNDDELHATALFEDGAARGYLGPRDLDFFSLYPFPEGVDPERDFMSAEEVAESVVQCVRTSERYLVPEIVMLPMMGR